MKSIFDFAKGNALPGKEKMLEAALNDEITRIRGMRGSMVEYLI